MKQKKQPQKRIQNSPVRIHDDLDQRLREIADNEARAIGQVVNATLRYAMDGITKDNWFETVQDYLRQ